MFLNPLYDSQLALCYKLGSAILFWTAGTGLATKYIGKVFELDGVILWLFGTPFIVAGVFLHHVTTVLENQSDLTSAELNPKIFKKYLIDALNALDKYVKCIKHDKLLMRSIVHHRNLCGNQSCTLKEIDMGTLANPTDTQFIQATVLKAIEELFKQILNVSFKSSQIRFLYIVFLVERVKKYKEALIEISLSETANSSLEERLILIRYKLIIRAKISEKSAEKSRTDVSAIQTLLGTEQTTSEFMECLSTTTSNKIKIMNELIQEKPDIVKQYEFSREFAQALKKLVKLWNNIKKANIADFRLCMIYKKFTSLVLLDKEETSRLTNDLTQELFYSQRAFAENFSEINKQLPANLNIAIVSNSFVGDLVYWKISSQYLAFLGFQEKELTRNSIGLIIPNGQTSMLEHIKKRLQKLSMNQFDSEYFQKEHFGFVKRKTGFIVPVFSKVSVIKSTHGLSHLDFYLHSLRPVAETRANVHILCDSGHSVTDWSSEALVWMEKFSRSVMLGTTKIEVLEPDFSAELKNARTGLHRDICIGKFWYSAICKVSPLKFGVNHVSAKNLSSQKQLALSSDVIYHVKYSINNVFRPSKYSNMFLRPGMNLAEGLALVSTNNIWAQYDGSYFIDDYDKIEGLMGGWKSTKLLDDNQGKATHINVALITTKRLYGGKIRDLEKEEFQFKDSEFSSENHSETEAISQKTEVFQDSLAISNLNKQQIAVESAERIFEQIFKQERTNPIHKVFNIIQFVWAALLISCVILSLIVWGDYVKMIATHVNDHIFITELIEKSTYLNDQLIDLDFLSRNITFRNENAEYRKGYVSKWTDSLKSF
jgi:hypothetical protein